MTAPAPSDRTTIEVTKNGPYVVSGPCRLRDSRGGDVPARRKFALCRCGNSMQKPFCDGISPESRTFAGVGRELYAIAK